MVFLKNGDLIIVSGTLKGGKVWHIKSPQKGILTPKVLRSYSSLNPEGVALSHKDGYITVLFDQGEKNLHGLKLSFKTYYSAY